MAVVAPSLAPTVSVGGTPAEPGLGLVREILDELDRERTKRAELEAQVRRLLAEKKDRAKGENDFTISLKHYIALQEELKSYRDLIEAMTMSRPAISAAHTRQKAVNKNSTNLPLYMIRLLEIMPWDPRASEYAVAKEEMYEWQFYDQRQKTWAKDVRKSTKLFQALPIEEPKPGLTSAEPLQTRGILEFLGNESAPPSSCVLTNHAITKLYNLKKGYPLPQDGGTWQWVGGWRVEKRILMNEDTQSASSSSLDGSSCRMQRVDCDDDGWSYAMESCHFALDPTEMCWDNPGENDSCTRGKKKGILRPVRRRKWTRQRALVDYPHASESTKCFLKLMAQRMYATLVANKISEQLVDTKVALTETESVLLQCKDESARQGRLLGEVLQARGKAKDITHKDTRMKITAATDAANQMQQDILNALTRDNSTKNCPSSSV